MRFATSNAVYARRRFQGLLLLMTALAAVAAIPACSSGDKTLDEVDPKAVAANPTFDQVNAIIHNKCVICHDARAAARTSARAPDCSDRAR